MTLRINETRYQDLTRSPNGTVGLWLGRKGKEMESVAKNLATTLRLVRTGRYRASIHAVLTTDGFGLLLLFGSAVGYARILEEGSPPHRIMARGFATRNQNLPRALWWDMPNDRGWMVQPDSGRPVPVVFHPGTPRYQVLHIAALRVLGGGIA